MVFRARQSRTRGRDSKAAVAAVAGATLFAPLTATLSAGCGDDSAKAPVAARDGGQDDVVTAGCQNDSECTAPQVCREATCVEEAPVETPDAGPVETPVPEPVACPSDESRVWAQVKVDEDSWISGTEGSTFVVETNDAPVSYTLEYDAGTSRLSLVSQTEVTVPEIGTGVLKIDLASGGVVLQNSEGTTPVPGSVRQDAFAGNIAREVLPRLELAFSDTETPTRQGTVALNVDGEVVVLSEMADGRTAHDSEAGTQVVLKKVTDNGVVVDITNANGRREDRYLSREDAGFTDSASSVTVVAVNDKSTEATGTTVEVAEEGAEATVTPFACQETPAANLRVDVNALEVVSPEVHGALEVGRVYSLGDGVGVEISKHVVDDSGVDVVELKVGEVVGESVLGENQNVGGVQRFGRTVTLVAGGASENMVATFTMGNGDLTQTYTVTFSGINSAE